MSVDRNRLNIFFEVIFEGDQRSPEAARAVFITPEPAAEEVAIRMAEIRYLSSALTDGHVAARYISALARKLLPETPLNDIEADLQRKIYGVAFKAVSAIQHELYYAQVLYPDRKNEPVP